MTQPEPRFLHLAGLDKMGLAKVLRHLVETNR
jgi:hypothetical protein